MIHPPKDSYVFTKWLPFSYVLFRNIGHIMVFSQSTTTRIWLPRSVTNGSRWKNLSISRDKIQRGWLNLCVTKFFGHETCMRTYRTRVRTRSGSHGTEIWDFRTQMKVWRRYRQYFSFCPKLGTSNLGTSQRRYRAVGGRFSEKRVYIRKRMGKASRC